MHSLNPKLVNDLQGKKLKKWAATTEEDTYLFKVSLCLWGVVDIGIAKQNLGFYWIVRKRSHMNSGEVSVPSLFQILPIWAFIQLLKIKTSTDMNASIVGEATSESQKSGWFWN